MIIRATGDGEKVPLVRRRNITLLVLVPAVAVMAARTALTVHEIGPKPRRALFAVGATKAIAAAWQGQWTVSQPCTECFDAPLAAPLLALTPLGAAVACSHPRCANPAAGGWATARRTTSARATVIDMKRGRRCNRRGNRAVRRRRLLRRDQGTHRQIQAGRQRQYGLPHRAPTFQNNFGFTGDFASWRCESALVQ
jgi:hypothetical protein